MATDKHYCIPAKFSTKEMPYTPQLYRTLGYSCVLTDKLKKDKIEPANIFAFVDTINGHNRSGVCLALVTRLLHRNQYHLLLFQETLLKELTKLMSEENIIKCSGTVVPAQQSE